MKWKKLCLTVVIFGCLLLPARAGERPVKVLVTGEGAAARILSQDGDALQDLIFDSRGQTVAGPLIPGVYEIRSGGLEAEFTLCPNGAVTQVRGDGWTDGEILHLGAENTGRLTIRYDRPWQWTLSGENADQAWPSLSGGICVFDRLPLGAYRVEGPSETIPVLLTRENPSQILDFRHQMQGNVGIFG